MQTGIVNLLEAALKRQSLQDAKKNSGMRQQKSTINHVKSGERDSIPIKLADWVLRETVFAGEPVERAMVHLAEALTPEQLDAVRATIKAFGLKRDPLRVIEQVKPGEVPELDAGGRTLKGVKPYPPAPGTNPKEGVAGETPAAYAGPTEATEDAVAWIRVRGDRMKRNKLSTVDLSRARPAPPQEALRQYDEQAAAAKDTGGGKILGPIVEETQPNEVSYPRHSHYTLTVTGNSMYPRIFPGDTIIVQKMDLYLPAFEDGRKVDPKPWQALDNKLVVAVKNQDELAVVKRLTFGTKRGGHFRIDLISDNPKAKPVDIDKDDTLHVIGLVVRILRDPDNLG